MTIDSVPSVPLASVVAAVLLAGAPPMAYADPQDGSQQCPGPGTNGQGTDQQCQGQGDPARKAVDEAKDAADQAQKQLQEQQQRQAKKDPMSQGLMYLVNGVPTCLHSGDVLTNVTVTPAIP